MEKYFKHKLVDLFLKMYTRRWDFTQSRIEFNKLEEKNFSNIIIYSTTALGDFLLNTPAIHAVRKRFKNAFITLICHQNFKSFLEDGADWDKVITWNNKVNHIPNLLREINKSGKPDLAIILHSHNPYDYLSAIMSGAKFVFRDNYNENKLIEKWLTNYVESYRGHIIQRKLELIKPLGCDTTSTSCIEMHLPCCVSTISKNHVSIGFQMGASSPERCWPVKNFVQVASHILSNDNTTQIVLIGSPNDMHLQQDFMALLPGKYHNRINQLIGKTTLVELTQKINELDVLVTGDTGPMHIAIALKVPTISLFVTAFPYYTGPYQNPEFHNIIVGAMMPLNRINDTNVMAIISPDVVLSEVDKVLCGTRLLNNKVSL
ncbi:putative LPS biosynthesis enzyme (Lipopolysaccharide core biosynthesi protein rfaq) [Xenorhabdus poinarii G6]|uniref:Putative LPS biosynthesis enzyme (Lipopolysaccharide core biosynthesi protein rfaq) n=1 Tax=Xenorhabdus poinarii G6 TaxID=1354304 RepID=A0A068R8G7_9GAMM|nr:glycosyltransferase family 9 protein [Xenorhabdus poinarii]CDG23259.1 putative LPS biosynthesis enzyme (Lipopolysaccharide core biosynthesi protein rfaq) [Xenorhabdus poinarii G6]